MGTINKAIHYPKAKDEPKGYVHFNHAKSVVPEWGDVAPSRVRVYMNLRLMCLSVLNAGTGRLYCHAHNVRLANAKFKVQQAGRRRVLKEQRKNVHAYIVGDWRGLDLQTCPVLDPKQHWMSASYDPYKHKHFVTEPDHRPLHEADEVLVYDRTAIGYMDHGNIFYKPSASDKKGRLEVKKMEKTLSYLELEQELELE